MQLFAATPGECTRNVVTAVPCYLVSVLGLMLQLFAATPGEGTRNVVTAVPCYPVSVLGLMMEFVLG